MTGRASGCPVSIIVKRNMMIMDVLLSAGQKGKQPPQAAHREQGG